MAEEDSINVKLLKAADGQLDDVKRLLADGAEVDYSDKFGETALMNACRGGHNAIVHYLVHNAKADVNAHFPQKSGWTALMFAGYFGHLDLVTYLVACGANPELKNKKDQSVLTKVPCMHATLETVAQAIEKGKGLVGNPPNIVIEKKEEKLADDAESKVLLKRAQQYTKISATATTREALIQFKGLYTRTCSDFHQEPVPMITGAITGLIALEKEREEGGEAPSVATLPLCGKESSEKLIDSQVFPLFEVLGHGFPNCPFQTIDFSWNNIRNSGAKAIAVYLTQTRTLTALDLTGNKCEQLGMEKLAQSLYGQNTLKSLKLNTNPIGDVGLAKLAEALLGNTELEELDLGNTDLGTVALVKIASAIRADTSLKVLDLSNPLLYSQEEETTIAIAKAIGNNSNLKRLSMKKHGMTDHGAQWLSEYLVPNSNLEFLDLSCNRLTDSGVALLAAAIARRSVGCTIPLDNCPLKCREHDEILEAIQQANQEGTQMEVTWTSEFEKHQLVAKRRSI